MRIGGSLLVRYGVQWLGSGARTQNAVRAAVHQAFLQASSILLRSIYAPSSINIVVARVCELLYSNPAFLETTYEIDSNNRAVRCIHHYRNLKL